MAEGNKFLPQERRRHLLGCAKQSEVLGGVAPAPVEVKEAEAQLVGLPFDEQSIAAAAEACYLKARPLDNTDFVMGWRKQMARPFALRALQELRQSCGLTP